MSSTNKTTNYELSQVLGTDKPGWLADYNSDMSKIDAQMKLNADTATAANGAASAANTAIGTLASLTTDVKTSLVGAINEVDAHANTAQNTANGANTTANEAATNIAKFNLTQKSTLTPSVTLGSIYPSLTNVQFATDTTGSVFKIYGRIYINNLSNASGTMDIIIGQTSLRPTTEYEINSSVIQYRVFTDNSNDVAPRNLTIGTDGSIKIKSQSFNGNVKELSLILPPCLYFNSDFGDV